jgi:hypothetical protein
MCVYMLILDAQYHLKQTWGMNALQGPPDCRTNIFQQQFYFCKNSILHSCNYSKEK